MGDYNDKKEVKCPNCESSIDYLNEYSKSWTHYETYIDPETGEFEWNFRDNIMDDMADIDYECPECSELITHRQTDAERFLRGEWDGKKTGSNN